MEKNPINFDRAVKDLFVLKKNKQDSILDKQDRKLLERLIKVELFSCGIIMFAVIKSVEMRFRGKKSPLFIPKDVTFRSLRRS